MIKLFSEEEFTLAKSRELLPLQCIYCSNTFLKSKKAIKDCINPNRKEQGVYCSQKCNRIHLSEKENSRPIKTLCNYCNSTFYKKPCEMTERNFCSRSCAATFNNKNKSHGNRRSKLEIYLETELTKLYPSLEFHFNRKDTINSELDIYVPSLKLAFELNGIFHYEPIFGSDKLYQIQNNDHRKFQACLEQGIELCIIDSSSLKYFKETYAKNFLSIIKEIIDKKFF